MAKLVPACKSPALKIRPPMAAQYKVHLPEVLPKLEFGSAGQLRYINFRVYGSSSLLKNLRAEGRVPEGLAP